MLGRLLRRLVGGSVARAQPDPAPGYLASGLAAHERGEWKKALTLLECAVSLTPQSIEARMAFAAALLQADKALLAREQYEAVLRIDPSHDAAREALAALEREPRMPRMAAATAGEAIRMALTLPHLLDSRDEIRLVREQLDLDLQRLSNATLAVRDPAAEVGLTAFYLAYHGLDDRAFHERIAALHLSACPALAYAAPGGGDPDGGRRIRVGLVSDYFYNHSIGRVSEGLIARLDRKRFSVHVFGFREPFDEISRAIAATADEWTVLPRALKAAREAVGGRKLDVLLYPDVGMEPLTYFMTFARLAPVQCATWGHPVTTGVPAIDYFLSTDYFEPDDGASHYSERLVRLRDVAFPGYYARRAEVPQATRAALGFDETRRTYFCPQSLFKFHPDFDSVLAEILRRDPGGDVVLVYDERVDTYLKARLQARLERTAPDVFERIAFVPRAPGREGYLQRLQACDVVLDTHPYCGGNTSLEAISSGALVVTRPATLNRGRHTYGFFRKMRFTDTIAYTEEDYIDLAVRIATDRDYSAHLKRVQAERAAALYEDQSAVDQLGDFFERTVARA